jgi:transposase
MVVLGVDVHKRTHTLVAVDAGGRKLDERTVPATSAGHAEALGWARVTFGTEVVWGVEDCRVLSARLEHDLLDAGQRVVRVPPRLTARTRVGTQPR